MNFNDYISQNNCEKLVEAFGKVINGPLSYEGDDSLEVAEVVSVQLVEPKNNFDTCYKFSISYEYIALTKVQVTNVKDGTVVYSNVLEIRVPKFQNDGFIYKSSSKTQPRFRAPFIKADYNTSAYLFDDVLILKASPFTLRVRLVSENGSYMLMVYNDKGQREWLEATNDELAKYKLDKSAYTKLNLLFGENFSEYLTVNDLQVLEALRNDSSNTEKFKERTPLDYEFNDICLIFSKTFKQSARGRYWKKINEWRKNHSINASTIQSIINNIFSIGEGSDILVADETNSLTTEMQTAKVYFYDSKDQKDQVRYNRSFVGVICPVDTPETNLINKKNEAALGAQFIDGKPYVKVYDKDFNEVYLDILSYYTSKILISDCIDYDLKLTTGLTCRTGLHGDHILVNSLDEIDYFESEPYNRLSLAVSLVPGVNSTDQIKASIGAKMLGQATSCVGSQKALVYTGTEKLVYENSDKVLKSKYDGIVKAVEGSRIYLTTDEGEKVIEIPTDRQLSDKTVLHFNTQVKPGDRISESDVVAMTNEFKDREFAPYINLNTAFWNYKGYDFLDGVILTEHSIRKCAIKRLGSAYLDINPNTNYAFNLESIKKIFDFNESSEENLFKDLDDFGIIKEGSKIESLDVLWCYAKSPTAKNLIQELLIQANPDDLESKVYQVPHGVADGVVEAVQLQVNPKYKSPIIDILKAHFSKMGYSIVNIETNAKIAARIAIDYSYLDIPKIGDKFSNRWASKATISHIIPEAEIPLDDMGNEIECIMAPDSTWKRKNPKQIVECQLGRLSCMLLKDTFELKEKGDYNSIKDILSKFYDNDAYLTLDNEKIDTIVTDAEKIGGFRVKVPAIDHKYTNKYVNSLYKKFNKPTEGKVYMPEFGRYTRNPVVTGISSIMRLHFIVQDKAKATSGTTPTGDNFIMGYGSSRAGGQSISDMTMWSLMAHNELDLYDYLTDHAGRQFKKELVNNLAWIGLKLQKEESK